MEEVEQDRWRLRHIIESIEYIEEFISGVEKKDMFSDYQLQSALVKQFEIIGEATRHLSPKLMDKYSEVNWSEAIGMRNILVHDYFAVNLDVLWDTIKNNIPVFKRQIVKILQELKE